MSEGPNKTLINLALLPFALVGIIILGTCGLCVAVVAVPTEDPPAQAEPANPDWYKSDQP